MMYNKLVVFLLVLWLFPQGGIGFPFILYRHGSPCSTFLLPRQYRVAVRRQSSLNDAQQPVPWSPLSVDNNNNDNDDSRREDRGDVHLPSTGISVFDEMEMAQTDRFVTEVVPIKGLQGIAQLVTSPMLRADSYEPVRYLVALSPPAAPVSTSSSPTTTESNAGATEPESISLPSQYVMVDVPPYSPQLVTRLQAFMGVGSQLTAILMTNRDSIHYDDAAAVFSTRRADLKFWKQAFPELAIVGYRLDIPRDCRDHVTQVLDGYGPFAAATKVQNSSSFFVETGRPLTYQEWDRDVAETVLNAGKKPPDDDSDVSNANNPADDNDNYSPAAIRQREEGKSILAVYTPGHSFGSVSYIFPHQRVVCSGYTIPVEENRAEENEGASTGPALDCRGYITTSRAGITRQMASAQALVDTYIDRFTVVLPARGDPLFLDNDNTEERRQFLTEVLAQYQKIGEIYEQLGITREQDNDKF